MRLNGAGELTLTNTNDSSATGTGALQVSGGISAAKSITASTLRLMGSTSGNITINAPTTVTSYSLTLPNALPTSAGYALVSNLAGQLSFAPAGGDVTAGTGLTKSGSILSVNASQTQITSVGTLNSLNIDGTLNLGNIPILNGTTTIVTGTGPAYPPAALTDNTTTLTGQTFGNGTYVVNASSIPTYVSNTYPPTALTGATSSLGDGTYVVSISSIYDATSYAGYYAFDKSSSTYWYSSPSNYSTTSPYQFLGTAYTVVSGSTVIGEWIQLQLPYPIIATAINIMSASVRSSTSWVVAGSVDGANWTTLYSTTSVLSGGSTSTYKTTQLTNLQQSTYLRLILRNSNGASYAGIVDLNFTGYISYYPPAPLTSATTTLPDGQYTATASSNSTSSEGYRAFNNLGSSWASAQGTYNLSSGTYSGSNSTVASGTTYAGEWVQLQCPVPIYAISSTVSSSPYSWLIIAGSNDGVTWSLLYNNNNIVWSGAVITLPYTSNIGFYSYFRLIVPKIGSSYTYAVIGEHTINTPSILPYNAFDKNSSTIWRPNTGTYSSSTGNCISSSTTTVTGTPYTGEYIQLTLPTSIAMKAMVISCNSAGISNYVIAGSTDGTTWYMVSNGSFLNWSTNTTQTVTWAGTTTYTYYRLIVLSISVPTVASFAINEVSFSDTVTTTTRNSLQIDNVQEIAPSTDNITNLGSSTKRFSAVYATNGTIQTSDERLKSDLAILSPELGLNFIKELQPMTYKMPLMSSSGDNLHHMGLSAQNVLNALERTQLKDIFAGIEYAPDGTLMMNYAQLIAPLCKAIQQLDREREEMKDVISLLCNERENMKNAISDLSNQLSRLRKCDKQDD